MGYPGIPPPGYPLLADDRWAQRRPRTVLGTGAATPALALPTGSALGATWDVSLIEEVGAELGREARAQSARVLLGPTVNLQRAPLAGRTFECFAEDPYLSGALGAAYVAGVQSQGVAATVKHLAGNEAEWQRNSVDSIIDERSLREIYLLPFERCVQAGALAVMTAYNRLNGDHCPNNDALLTGVLRGEWGFTGIVMTDWWGLLDTNAAANAGLDLEMPARPAASAPRWRTPCGPATSPRRSSTRSCRGSCRCSHGSAPGTTEHPRRVVA